MEVLFRSCAGLDVHKKQVTACILCSDSGGAIQHHIKRFATTTGELVRLANWLQGFNVSHVAMESTGVYWKPIFNVLDSQVEVWIVNALYLKQVPGRKTDVGDAQWIAQLMRHGLLKRSFIPDMAQRDLRDLTRYRTRLTAERSAASNRLQKVLEDANIKLSSVATDIQGVSGRQMLAAMIAGETDATQLANMAKGRMRPKIPQLEAALTGHVRDHHRYMWQEILLHLDEIDARLAALNMHIRESTAPHEATIHRLSGIPGVDRYTAEVILAEMGPDVTPFPTAKHLAAWACLCPGNNISANKRRSGKTRRGQKWLRTALVQAAWAASRTKNTYLSAQFRRLRSRRGAKRAAVAVAHSILIVVYHLLTDTEAVFHELGGDHFLKRNEEYVKRQAVQRLEALGLQVTLAPAPA